MEQKRQENLESPKAPKVPEKKAPGLGLAEFDRLTDEHEKEEKAKEIKKISKTLGEGMVPPEARNAESEKQIKEELEKQFKILEEKYGIIEERIALLEAKKHGEPAQLKEEKKKTLEEEAKKLEEERKILKEQYRILAGQMIPLEARDKAEPQPEIKEKGLKIPEAKNLSERLTELNKSDKAGFESLKGLLGGERVYRFVKIKKPDGTFEKKIEYLSLSNIKSDGKEGWKCNFVVYNENGSINKQKSREDYDISKTKYRQWKKTEKQPKDEDVYVTERGTLCGLGIEKKSENNFILKNKANKKDKGINRSLDQLREFEGVYKDAVKTRSEVRVRSEVIKESKKRQGFFKGFFTGIKKLFTPKTEQEKIKASESQLKVKKGDLGLENFYGKSEEAKEKMQSGIDLKKRPENLGDGNLKSKEDEDEDITKLEGLELDNREKLPSEIFREGRERIKPISDKIKQLKEEFSKLKIVHDYTSDASELEKNNEAMNKNIEERRKLAQEQEKIEEETKQKVRNRSKKDKNS